MNSLQKTYGCLYSIFYNFLGHYLPSKYHRPINFVGAPAHTAPKVDPAKYFMTLSGAIFLSFLAFLQRTRQLTRVLQVPHIAVCKLIPEHIRVIAHFFVPLRNMQHPVLHHFGIFNIPQRQHKRYSPLTNRLFRRPTIVSQVKPSYLLLGFLQFVNIYSCHICLIQ